MSALRFFEMIACFFSLLRASANISRFLNGSCVLFGKRDLIGVSAFEVGGEMTNVI